MAGLTDYAEYAALRGAIGALGVLPLRRAAAAGGWVARLGYRPLGIRRQVVESQIALAFPEWDRARVVDVARGSYEHLGRTTVEAARLVSLSRDEIIELVAEDVGFARFEEARRQGRGVVLVTGHLGNWEAGAAYVAARGTPIEAIVRQMGNPLFDRYLTGGRERYWSGVIRDAEAVRRVPRSLRANRVVAVMADQGVKGMASTFVPFFGRLAKTPRGAAVFALRFDAPIVFALMIRLPSGRFRFIAESVEVQETGDRERDVDTIVARYTAVLEKWVRVYPEQYFWQHRRWRRQPTEAEAERAMALAAKGSAPAF
jgi:KDO2-lipid IV(A) lauroyltransferase